MYKGESNFVLPQFIESEVHLIYTLPVAVRYDYEHFIMQRFRSGILFYPFSGWISVFT